MLMGHFHLLAFFEVREKKISHQNNMFQEQQQHQNQIPAAAAAVEWQHDGPTAKKYMYVKFIYQIIFNSQR